MTEFDKQIFFILQNFWFYNRNKLSKQTILDTVMELNKLYARNPDSKIFGDGKLLSEAEVSYGRSG